jgi:8-oxo-dGTP pyrophosphatase MutT (NUDIX family)
MKPTIKPRDWEILSSRILLDCPPYLSVKEETVKLPNGHVIKNWYVLDFPNWITVIAITKEDNFIVIDQYRPGSKKTNFEIVAGIVEPGEDPLKAAQRELLEETGYGKGEWQLLTALNPNPNNHRNLSFSYLATGVVHLKKQHVENTEDVRIHFVSRHDMWQMLVEGDFIHALHVAPLWKYFALNPMN